MTNKDLAIKFAQGSTKGKTKNMFIEGDKIYSYGYHFVIAKRVFGGFEITTSKYSQSTARQVSYVNFQIRQTGLEVTEVENLK